jgi:uncharacterized protein YdaU (DUF1376 family)
MHYFQFEIKEWIANTAHLSLEEESAYLRLIFYYYDSEKPIANADLDKIFRKCRIPKDLGCYILAEYFQCEDEQNWIHKRCDEEIARYHAKKEQASRAGKASAERRSNGRSTDVQPIINHKSLIINQESNKKNRTSVLCPDDVSSIIWDDYMAVRKAQKKPLTATALKGLEREAKKANISLEEVLEMCCERNWIGFKAEWIKNIPKQYNAPTSKNVSAARAIFGDERGLVNERAIDITPKKIT